MSGENPIPNDGSVEALRTIQELDWVEFTNEGFIRTQISRVLADYGQSIGLDVLESVVRYRPDILLTTRELGEVVTMILRSGSRDRTRRVMEVLLKSLSAIMGIQLSFTNLPIRQPNSPSSERSLEVLKKSREKSFPQSTMKEVISLVCLNLRKFHARSTISDLDEMKAHLGFIFIFFYNKTYQTLFKELFDVLESENFLAVLLSLISSGLTLPSLYSVVLVNHCLDLYLRIAPGQVRKLLEEVLTHDLSNDERTKIDCFRSLNSFIYASMFDQSENRILRHWRQQNQLPEKLIKFIKPVPAKEDSKRVCVFCTIFAHVYESEFAFLLANSDPIIIPQFQNQMQSTGLMNLAMTHVLDLVRKLRDLNIQQLEAENPKVQISCFEIFKTQAHLLSFLGFSITCHPENSKYCDVQLFMDSLVKMMEIWESIIGHVKEGEIIGIGVEACVKMLEILVTLVHYKTRRIPDILDITSDSFFLRSGVIIQLFDALNRIVEKKLSLFTEVRLLVKEIALLARLDLFIKYIPRAEFEGAKQRSKEKMKRSVSLAVQRLRTLQRKVQQLTSRLNVDELRDQLQEAETWIQRFQSIDLSACQDLASSNQC